IRYTPASLTGHTRIFGGASADYILLDLLPTVDLARKFLDASGLPASLVTGNEAVRARNLVELDGQGAGDTYELNLTGSSDYIVRVLESGAANDGSDALTLNGTGTDDL